MASFDRNDLGFNNMVGGEMKQNPSLENNPCKDLLEKQINKEFESWYIYLAISKYFQVKKLVGFSKFFNKAADEELTHGNKQIEYMNDRNWDFSLLPISESNIDTSMGTLDVVKFALKHETEVTASLKELLNCCRVEDDNLLETLILWFIKEQIEEEAKFLTLIDELKFAGDNSAAILILDREYGGG